MGKRGMIAVGYGLALPVGAMAAGVVASVAIGAAMSAGRNLRNRVRRP